MQPTQGYKTLMYLNKQCYYCKGFHHTFIADPPFVKRHFNLSTSLVRGILLILRDMIDIESIAREFGVCHQSVRDILHGTYGTFKQTFKYFPNFLCCDEFKSTKLADGALSFVYCDALTHELLDVVENRRLEALITYFMRFPLEVRLKVQGIVIDMYAPYAALIKKCFPQASIITDRFHIAQHLIHAVSIEVMKGFDVQITE